MKFRKKPVVIEAMLWDGENHRGMFDFLTGTENEPIVAYHGRFYIDFKRGAGGLVIQTLEGDHFANIGDYIVRGVKAELYPVKPDIFAMTYEQIEE